MKVSINKPRAVWHLSVSDRLQFTSPIGCLFIYPKEKGIDLFDCGYYLQLPKDAPARVNRGKLTKLCEWIGIKTGAIPNRWRPNL